MSSFLLHQNKYRVMSDEYSKTIFAKKIFNKLKLVQIQFSKNSNNIADYNLKDKILTLSNGKKLILNFDKTTEIDGIRLEIINPYELYKINGYIWRGHFNEKKIHLVLDSNNKKFYFSSKMKSYSSSKNIDLYQTDQNKLSNLIFSLEKIKKNNFELECINDINGLDLDLEIFSLILTSLVFYKF